MIMRKVTRRGVGLMLSLATLFMVSCSTTRTITTTQSHIKNGDTLTTMTTKMVETYKATKDSPVF